MHFLNKNIISLIFYNTELKNFKIIYEIQRGYYTI